MLTEAQKQVAQVFGIALCCSCCDREEIVRWADTVISTNSNPDYEFIEISTSDSLHILNLVSKLKEMSMNSNRYSALRTVLGRMYEIVSTDNQKLAVFVKGLDQIAIDHQHDMPDDLLFCNNIEDMYFLAHFSHYGNFSDVEQDFINCLKAHWTEKSATNNWYTG